MGSLIKETVFCTVITPDYMPFALTLHESLVEWHPDARLVVLLATTQAKGSRTGLPDRTGLSVMYADDLHGDSRSEGIFRKYHSVDMDAYRWACKPGLVRHLLRSEGIDRAVFCDCDIWFTGSVSEIIDGLENAPALLTPHWFDASPEKAGGSFNKWFIYGIFNAGFFAANRLAEPILDWWQLACLGACCENRERGLFVDQKYLDLIPCLFPKVRVLLDQRYNVGGWRLDGFLREHGNTWPLPPGEAPAFVHFTCLHDIAFPGPGEDVLAEYSRRLQQNGLPYNLLEREKARRENERRLAEARQERDRRRGSLGARLRRRLALGTRVRHLIEALKPRPQECEW